MIVFARAPVPGRAKTRLIPALGAGGAARLQRRMTTRTVAMAGAPEVHGTAPHGYFRSLRAPLRLQKGRDLGERMHRAIERGLRRHRAVILIGTDCPVLNARDLSRAARLLCSRDVVLAPAEDGGYALVGMSRPCAAIFEGIEWGSGSVLRETIVRMDRAGLRWGLLRTVWDVDRPEDLERLRSLRFPSGARRGARR